MLACRHHAIGYVSVPKAACTTIKNLMYIMDNGRQLDDPLTIHKSGALLTVNGKSPDYRERMQNTNVVFTFVREPAARIYSCFNDKVATDHAYNFSWLRARLEKHFGYEHPRPGEQLTVQKHSDNFLRFLAFVRLNLVGKTRLKVDGHWNLQSKLIFGKSMTKTPDFIGRVERFNEGMKLVLDYGKYKQPLDLSLRFNEAPRPPFALHEVLSDDALRLIEDIYERDYIVFGYDRGRPAAMTAAAE